MTVWIVIVIVILLVVLLWSCHRANVVDWGHRWVNLLDGFLRIYIRFFHRFRYQPVPLPDDGPALLVSNHISGLDPLLMIAACKRPVRFLIAQEQYEKPLLNWVFRQVGCIPLQRGARVDRAFRAALQSLEQGEVVGLFPEGAIHTRREPAKRLKNGVARLAELSHAPVYPVTISGILIEGFTMLTLFMPNRARLKSHPVLACDQLGDKTCMARLSELLLVNSD